MFLDSNLKTHSKYLRRQRSKHLRFHKPQLPNLPERLLYHTSTIIPD